MRPSRCAATLTVAALLLCFESAVPAQNASPSQFRGGTTAIAVDVVVRDGRGRPVTDLTARDFELLEDGIPQVITDAQLVGGEVKRSSEAPGRTNTTPSTPAPPGAAPESKTVTPSTFIALVFDRLTPEGRALAYKGASSYLDAARDEDFAGVFLSDLSLVTVQPYTNDRAKISNALKDVASRATSRFDRAAIRPAAGEGTQNPNGDEHPDMPFIASAEHGGRFEPGGPVLKEIAGVMTRQATMWERMATEQQGYATTNALLAIVGGLAPLAGRKTVVFFAEGLSIPDSVTPFFRSVIAAANRANVSIYTVDAEGLRVHSTDQQTGREINAVGASTTVLATDGSSLNDLSQMERMEESLRKDPRTSLTTLAQETGGFLVNDTNDLRSGMVRIEQDSRFHYVLSYVPKNADFNGEWRALNVRVPGRTVVVRARSGYLAVRDPGAIPMFSYEARAVADLERTPAPAEIPIRASAFVFPDREGNAKVSIWATTSARLMRFETSAEVFRTDFTLLARVRGDAGDVVRKGSQVYRLSGPATDLAKAQAQDVWLVREPTLTEGHYTVEVAADDALAKRAGVVHFPIAISGNTGPKVSSLVLIRRTQKAEANPVAPALAVGDLQLVPNLGEPFRRSENLSFYATVIPEEPIPAATLMLTRSGAVLATLQLSLSGPDSTGRVVAMGQIPLAAVPMGDYELVLTVPGGATPVSRVAHFSVIEQ